MFRITISNRNSVLQFKNLVMIMENNKHIKGFNEATENLNISDVNESFTLEDMEKCWIAARRKSFDTGLSLYSTFEDWIDNYTKK